MNFLKACQETNTKLGTQGAIDSVNATGYQGSLIDMVKSTWIDIQNLHPTAWLFLKVSTTFNTIASQSIYTINDIFGTTVNPVSQWIPDMLYYDKGALLYIPYEKYILMDNDTTSSPKWFTTDPITYSIILNLPDGVYSINPYYYRVPQVLADNTDELICPDQFAWSVVYKAASNLAGDLGHNEKYIRNYDNANASIGSMRRLLLPAKKINSKGIA